MSTDFLLFCRQGGLGRLNTRRSISKPNTRTNMQSDTFSLRICVIGGIFWSIWLYIDHIQPSSGCACCNRRWWLRLSSRCNMSVDCESIGRNNTHIFHNSFCSWDKRINIVSIDPRTAQWRRLATIHGTLDSISPAGDILIYISRLGLADQCGPIGPRELLRAHHADLLRGGAQPGGQDYCPIRMECPKRETRNGTRTNYDVYMMSIMAYCEALIASELCCLWKFRSYISFWRIRSFNFPTAHCIELRQLAILHYCSSHK